MARDVIGDWSRSLRVTRHHRQAIARELQAHVEDVQHELELSGWNRQQAEEEALARLGNLEQIGEELTQVHRAPHRGRLGLAFTLAGALLVGAYGASGSLASATPAHRSMAHVSAAHHARHHRVRR